MKAIKNNNILVIEDSEEDFDILKRTLSKINSELNLIRCSHFSDLETFTSNLDLSYKNFPSLILLDLNLPGSQGDQVLTYIKHNSKICRIPVIIVSTSENPLDIKKAYDGGASGYITKSMDLQMFRAKMRTCMEYWFESVELVSWQSS